MNLTELEYMLSRTGLSAADKRELVIRHIRAALDGKKISGVRLTVAMAEALVGRDEQTEILDFDPARVPSNAASPVRDVG